MYQEHNYELTPTHTRVPIPKDTPLMKCNPIYEITSHSDIFCLHVYLNLLQKIIFP